MWFSKIYLKMGNCFENDVHLLQIRAFKKITVDCNINISTVYWEIC